MSNGLALVPSLLAARMGALIPTADPGVRFVHTPHAGVGLVTATVGKRRWRITDANVAAGSRSITFGRNTVNLTVAVGYSTPDGGSSAVAMGEALSDSADISGWIASSMHDEPWAAVSGVSLSVTQVGPFMIAQQSGGFLMTFTVQMILE